MIASATDGRRGDRNERIVEACYRVVGGLLTPETAEAFAGEVRPDRIPDPVLRAAAAVALDMLEEYGPEFDPREFDRRVHAALGRTNGSDVRSTLADCVGAFVTPASMRRAIRELEDERSRLELTDLARRLTADAGADRPVAAILADMREDLAGIERSAAAAGAFGRVSLADLLDTDPADETDSVIPTRMRWFDAALPGGGLRRGDVVLLGGGPGVGKTALALNIELSVLEEHPTLRVSHVAGEMLPRDLRNRCLSWSSNLTAEVLRRPWDRLSPLQRQAKMTATEHLRALGDRLTITQPPITPSVIREVVRRDRPDLLVIDYLQLVAADEPMPSRREVVDASMRCIREIASAEGIVALVLSEAAKPPRGGELDAWSAFKESSGLIYACDLAFVGERVPSDTPRTDGSVRIDWKCFKARHGARVDIPTRLDGALGRYFPA